MPGDDVPHASTVGLVPAHAIRESADPGVGTAALYRGAENDRGPVPTPTQASQLRDALLLAYCQPAVGAFFNFELSDERRLRGWQSGLLYGDGTPKPAYGVFRDTVAAIRAGQVDCAQAAGAG